ncbi:DnaA N-terminal domain-containing protein [Hydrogenovibrio thermophilus]|uniref:DnaA N-terminal domain-containing protein n=1 Tax=Hydrogenovibrio thermophilus TaxID=265883 RepID=A0A451G538_9GAMM|nr:DnaA N-terminal domain-containing protein [Hydrogenovibrio thermophilus]QAB14610.1 hypothetical protein EPV75_02475 [Hydrogenovibrio thermophilus]
MIQSHLLPFKMVKNMSQALKNAYRQNERIPEREEVEPQTWLLVKEQMKTSLTDTEYLSWIHPLKAIETENELTLIAPAGFILDRVKTKYIAQIKRALKKSAPEATLYLSLS